MLDRYDQDLLLDYLEDELDGDRRAQLDAMLAEDPELAALLQEMAQDRAALRSLPEAQAPGDLVHDVTSTLERKMLLDGPTNEDGPIPISRGRGIDPEPARSISWGRVLGLTGLAASVALAAGIVVFTLDDPLQRTANELAAAPTEDAVEETETYAYAESESSAADKLAGLGREKGDQALLADKAESGPKQTPAPALEGLASDTDREPIAGVTERLDRVAPPHPATTPERDPQFEPVAAGSRERIVPGTAAAISVTQPGQQLLLLTDSPEVSREQLVAFCLSNGIPIVKPEERANAKAVDEFKGGDAGVGDLTGVAQGDAQASTNDYALLINDRQLDTLVLDLNRNTAIDSNRAGKGSLFSNQAAVLADLPEETAHRYFAPGEAQRARTLQPEPAAERVVQEEAREEAAKDFGQQQAIQLQLPDDLGSEFANRRNYFNLKRAQQQTGHAQSVTRDAALDALSDDADLNESEEIAKPDPLAQAPAEKTELQEIESVPADASATVRDRATGQTQTQEAQGNAVASKPAVSIDPARGNWLSAHLPAANTTPLLLQWRSVNELSQNNLVHVTIKRAETDKVNVLRERQRAELTSGNQEAERQEAEPQDAEPAEAAKPISADEGDVPPDKAAE